MSYAAIKTTYLYTYDSLSESAKENARGWYRSDWVDYDWWDFVYEDGLLCRFITLATHFTWLAFFMWTGKIIN